MGGARPWDSGARVAYVVPCRGRVVLRRPAALGGPAVFGALAALLPRRRALVVSEDGQQTRLYPLPGRLVADVLHQLGEPGDPLTEFHHYPGGERGQLLSQDSGPFPAGAGPDAVQKFAHCYLVHAGVDLSLGRGDKPFEAASFPTGNGAGEAVEHLYSFQECVIHLQSRDFASILPSGRCGSGRGVNHAAAAPLERNLPGGWG
ncbi:hypothetical protein GCM10020254_17180 [Streptomyces goshikiensis]